MPEVIIDTNVIIDAIFQQYDDCWEIIKLLRLGKIHAVLSKDLMREYQFVPFKIIINQLSNKNISEKAVKILLSDLHRYSEDVSDLFFGSRLIYVTSKRKECRDQEDDKIFNLAYDANCTIIITKNISDFQPIIDKHLKTKTGKEINIYSPAKFLELYKCFIWAENQKA